MSSSSVASDRPRGQTSLYVSLPSLLGPLAPLALILAFAVYEGNLYLWSAFAVGWGFSLFWWLVAGTRRIDLDSEGLTLIPLVPLRRKQSFKWAELGSFEQNTSWKYSRSPRGILQAPVIGARPLNGMGGVYRS